MKFSATLGLALILCACSTSQSGSMVRNIEHYPLYGPDLLRWAVAGRDLPLDLIVETGPERQKAWQSAAGDALSRVSSLQSGRVTAWPDGSQRGNFHLAVVVNAPLGLTAQDACSGAIEPASLAVQDGKSHLLLAFCNEQHPVSTARAVVYPITDPGDPLFSSGLQAAATQALPRNDPELGKGSEPFLVP